MSAASDHVKYRIDSDPATVIENESKLLTDPPGLHQVDMETCVKLVSAMQSETKQFKYWGSTAMALLIGLDSTTPLIGEEIVNLISTAVGALATISIFVLVPVLSFTLIHIVQYFPYFEPRCLN